MFALTVTSLGSYTSPIGFSCSGLPAAAACSFSPATVTPDANPATTTLTITTAAQSALFVARSGWPLVGPVECNVAGAARPARRHRGDRGAQPQKTPELLPAVLLAGGCVLHRFVEQLPRLPTARPRLGVTPSRLRVPLVCTHHTVAVTLTVS